MIRNAMILVRPPIVLSTVTRVIQKKVCMCVCRFQQVKGTSKLILPEYLFLVVFRHGKHEGGSEKDQRIYQMSATSINLRHQCIVRINFYLKHLLLWVIWMVVVMSKV